MFAQSSFGLAPYCRRPLPSIANPVAVRTASWTTVRQGSVNSGRSCRNWRHGAEQNSHASRIDVPPFRGSGRGTTETICEEPFRRLSSTSSDRCLHGEIRTASSIVPSSIHPSPRQKVGDLARVFEDELHG